MCSACTFAFSPADYASKLSTSTMHSIVVAVEAHTGIPLLGIQYSYTSPSYPGHMMPNCNILIQGALSARRSGEATNVATNRARQEGGVIHIPGPAAAARTFSCSRLTRCGHSLHPPPLLTPQPSGEGRRGDSSPILVEAIHRIPSVPRGTCLRAVSPTASSCASLGGAPAAPAAPISPIWVLVP